MKENWRDYLLIDRVLSAVSVLVFAQPGSEVPEGLTNYPVLCDTFCVYETWSFGLSQEGKLSNTSSDEL
jgi:hypothetical protein